MISEKINKARLESAIDLLTIDSPFVIAFDFDELIVPIQLTKKIIARMSKPIDNKTISKLGWFSFEGLQYLHSLMIGTPATRYKRIRDEISSKTTFNDGIDKLLVDLKKFSSIIFITSGIKDVCFSKVKQLGFPENNIIGSEYEFTNDKISGSQLIITDKLKGFVISEIRKKHYVIGVGHDLGDKPMLDSSHVSISFQSKIPNFAIYNTEHPNEIYNIVKELIKKKFD